MDGMLFRSSFLPQGIHDSSDQDNSMVGFGLYLNSVWIN
jgi:hypothetical protein